MNRLQKVSDSGATNESVRSRAGRRERLDAPLDPVEAWERLEGLPGRMLLETGAGAAHPGSDRGAGRTLVTAGPRVVLTGRAGAARFEVGEGFGGCVPDGPAQAGGLDRLGRSIERLAKLESEAAGGSDGALLEGGWIGFLGYELADELERLPAPVPPRPTDPPELWFGLFDWALQWPDGPGAPPVLAARPLPGDDEGRRLDDLLDEVRSSLRAVPGPGRIAAGSPLEPATPPEFDALEGRPGARLSLGRERYVRSVERIRDYIRAGDLFQANLTCRIDRPLPAGMDGANLYRSMRERSPAPYSALLEAGEHLVLSISPESFLERTGGRIRTRPIKGTRPRGGDPATDRRLADELLASGKDRAENVMIVDLLRNDLSRIAKPNSVYVSALCALESHPTVHHLVSDVEGELREGIGWEAILSAVFPGGSITGAPKLRAIEVLRELEPVRRGPYTGAIGWIDRGARRATLSIAIRTAVLGPDGVARYGAGGGITLASDPDDEWHEMLAKARAFLDATEPSAP